MPWEDVDYRIETIEGPGIAECLAAIQSVYGNGGVILRSLQAVDTTEFDRASRLDYRGTEKMLQAVITHPTVVSGIPELQIPIPLPTPPEFDFMSAFGMEGELTQLLLAGGAYEKFEGSVNEVRSLTRAFMESVFGPELQQLWVNASFTPWTPWFFDIAWDHTFIVSDYRRRRFVLMCCTDTD